MWSSHAAKRPVAYSGLHARTPRKAVIIHTNGGGTDQGSLFGWWSAGARGEHGADSRHVGAHFQVMLNGKAEQYADTAVVVYHAYSASEWAVAIETEDDGHPAVPWTNAQLDTIIAICRELGVPGQLLKDSPSDGVGWHEMYADWNKTKHSCPGAVREKQIRDVILPALAAKPRPNVAPIFTYRRALRLGMVGTDVTALKRRLKAIGYGGTVAGPYFGRGLRTVICRFQKDHKLEPDGVVGPITANAINH